MSPLDEKYGEGSQDELAVALAFEGLVCDLTSQWHYPSPDQNTGPDQPKEDGCEGVELLLSWKNEHQEQVARGLALFLDDDPTALNWTYLNFDESYQGSGLRDQIWFAMPPWCTARGMDKIRAPVTNQRASQIFRQAGLEDDPERADAEYTALVANFGKPDDRINQYVAWKKGEGPMPSYYDDSLPK